MNFPRFILDTDNASRNLHERSDLNANSTTLLSKRIALASNYQLSFKSKRSYRLKIGERRNSNPFEATVETFHL